jgi:hypothetical protein
MKGWRWLVCAAALALSAPSLAAAPDPLEPTSSASAAVASPLKVITVMAEDLTAARRYFEGAFALRAEPFAVSVDDLARLRAFWGLEGTGPIQGIVFTRMGVPDAAIVRVIQAPAGAREARPGHDTEYPGILAMGFPVSPMSARDPIASAMGYPAVAGVTTMTLARADGSTYPVGETHYRGPDGVLALGIDRADMRPVGPIDPALSIGGPAYSSAVGEDADRFAVLLRDVLGFENRREFTFTSAGPSGGLALPAGTRVRFQQWFSPGARTGYLISVDLLNAGKPAPAPAGFASRGLAAWSFEVPDLRAAERRAKAAGITILSPPQRVRLPGLGLRQAMLLQAPDGFAVELYAR